MTPSCCSPCAPTAATASLSSVREVGELGAADTLIAVDDDERGDHFACHQALLTSELVDDLETARDAVRGVDDDRHGGDLSAEL